MHVVVTQATTGNALFDATHVALSQLRVWELRKHFTETLQCAHYFSWILFHELTMVDDCAFLSDLASRLGQEDELCLHAIQRSLRLPNDEERQEIIYRIHMGHRTNLWELLSRGISMYSTIPQGTARVNPLV